VTRGTQEVQGPDVCLCGLSGWLPGCQLQRAHLLAEVQEGEKSSRGAVRPDRPELDQVEIGPAETLQSYSEISFPRPKGSVTY